MQSVPDPVFLDGQPTLATGQCCDLKIDSVSTRVWLCRGDKSVSIERLRDGKWVLIYDHGQQIR
jgi:hypothetical protein